MTVKKVKNAIKLVIAPVKNAFLQYRRGNHEASIAGIIVGVILLGGALSGLINSALQPFISSNSSNSSSITNITTYINAFLEILGIIAIVGGLLEYREYRHYKKVVEAKQVSR